VRAWSLPLQERHFGSPGAAINFTNYREQHRC
jgi:hypothetical protein